MPASTAADEDMIDTIRATIADEMGVPMEDFLGQTDLASLEYGLSHNLDHPSPPTRDTGQELSPDFFVDNPFTTAIENALCPKSKPSLPTATVVEKSTQDMAAVF